MLLVMVKLVFCSLLNKTMSFMYLFMVPFHFVFVKISFWPCSTFNLVYTARCMTSFLPEKHKSHAHAHKTNDVVTNIIITHLFQLLHISSRTILLGTCQEELVVWFHHESTRIGMHWSLSSLYSAYWCSLLISLSPDGFFVVWFHHFTLFVLHPGICL